MFQVYERLLLREVGVVVWIHQKFLLHFLRKQSEIFPYHVQNTQELSKPHKECRVAFAQLYKKKLEKHFAF